MKRSALSELDAGHEILKHIRELSLLHFNECSSNPGGKLPSVPAQYFVVVGGSVGTSAEIPRPVPR
jgi:hypothetical protein